MNTRTIEAKCKECRGTIAAKADADCPNEWISKLLPMLTCNRCFDMHRSRRKCEDNIRKASLALKFPPKPLTSEQRQGIRGMISAQVLDYCKWIANKAKQREHHFSADIVDMIMDHPDKWWTILRDCHSTILSLYNQQPDQPELVNA